MAKWVKPMAKASGALITGALLIVAVGALESQQQAQQPSAAGPDSSAAFVAPADVDTAGLRGPEQPIFFRHDIHAGQYKIDCRYCHAYAEIGPNPGLPSTSVCIGCHRIVQTQNPEVQKILTADNDSTPLQWVQVHHLPQYVHFPHYRHVTAGGLACQECHGQVERMPRVYQYGSLKMGWCIDCHKARGQTTDCSACHY